MPGQFILTGSAVPADDPALHTGAMRITRLRMRPMSLHESGHSTAAVPLGGLLEGAPVRAPDPGASLAALATRVAVGRWPGLRDRDPDDALLAVRGYLDEIARSDLTRVDGVARDPAKVHLLLRSLARNAAEGRRSSSTRRRKRGAHVVSAEVCAFERRAGPSFAALRERGRLSAR